MKATESIATQYQKKKEEYKDAILFFQIGDFFEIFFDDALFVSKTLGLTLTQKRYGGNGESAAMCGVPAKAANEYALKLVKLGHKVAICSQILNEAGNVAAREVEAVHTPATIFDESLLDSSNNFLCAVIARNKTYEAAFIDVTTGEFFLHEGDKQHVLNLILKYAPKEILTNNDNLKKCETFNKTLLLNNLPAMQDADGTTVEEVIENYIKYTKMQLNLTASKKIAANEFMKLSVAVIRNLELFKNMRDGEVQGTLYSVLNLCKTPMGERKLMRFLSDPLLNADKIKARQKCVSEFFEDEQKLQQVRNALENMPDLERLGNKIDTRHFTPASAQKTACAIDAVCKLKLLLPHYNFKDLSAVQHFLNNALLDGEIAAGFDARLDEARQMQASGEQLLNNFLKAQKEKTKIKNMTLKQNKNFGYFLEVSAAYKNKVPFDYKPIQSTAGGERYTTEQLNDLSQKIALASQEKEYYQQRAFNKIKEFLTEKKADILTSARISQLADVYSTLALVARQNNYICPSISVNETIKIEGGRHPIVEKFTSNFISNNTNFENTTKIMLITGPNMGGKSTYMRQVALIVIMAQMGSFVPAQSAEIGIIDGIFTRVGAGDDIIRGNSTFMVEMTECCHILQNATNKSLIILDEVGRGTSTYDGLSIAYAIVKYISNKIKAKTFFATHYHELTKLENNLLGLKNFSVSIEEHDGNIIFLHKVIEGASGKSYGIEVAKLAGFPEEIISDAKDFLHQLETGKITANKQK